MSAPGPPSGGFPSGHPWGPPPQGHPWGPPPQGRPPWGQQPPQGPVSWNPPSWGQPPQGPPAWGAPGPAPGPRRPRSGARRVALVVAILVVLGALVLLALLAFVVGPRFARVEVLDRAAVERGVSDVVTRDWRHAVTGVQCPEDVRARSGESFVCSATVDGRPRRVPVDVLDDRGTYQVGQPR